jgi:predicted RNA-binding Zn-ribbon protein involved in translation (DUF1610 family)
MTAMDTTETKRCPNCGAGLDYNTALNGLMCDHCGYNEIINNDERVQRNQLTDEIRGEKEKWQDSRVFKCESCGASNIVSGKIISNKCPFCGGSSIIPLDKLGGFKPDGVVPFVIEKGQANAVFKKYIRSRFFTPANFKKSDIIDTVTPMYIPSWSFSSNAFGTYTGTLGESVTRQEGDKTIYETRWFPVSGVISERYNDYIVQSSTSLTEQTFKTLKPFDLQNVKPYRTEYFMGIVTEHYSKSLDDCFGDFANFVKKDLNRLIMFRHAATRVKKLDIKIEYRDKKFNYFLLPVFIANCRYKGKLFNYFINGISGKIVGKTPISAFKSLFCTFLALGMAGGVYFLLKYLNVL